jgi:N-acetylmuramic acid 6-phosphate etherase
MVELKCIPTEQRNAESAHIDTLSTREMVKLINHEDKKVAVAVEKEIDHIAAAVDLIYSKMSTGGRLIYVGAGTSGRLGILDAVECPPTFSTDPEQVQGLIAGGERAMFKAVEDAEDNPELGKADLEKIGFTKNDVLVGIAASGRTPYVLGAFKYARSIGAPTIAVTCCEDCEINRNADIFIAPTPGPEVIAGSTRMKSGTAQKMVLNMLSTCTMIRLGKVYGNLMVDVMPSNKKLIHRCVSIVCSATNCDEDTARQALSQCDYKAKTAIVMILCKCTAQEAIQKLEKNSGRIADVLRSEKIEGGK